MAEMFFHLQRGQPVFPSKLRFMCFERRGRTAATLSLPAPPDLAGLGFATARYGQLSYAKPVQEYPSTRQFAAAAHFLEFVRSTSPAPATPAPILFCSATESPLVPSPSPGTMA